MRRLSCLLLTIALSLPLFSQERDSLLRRINQIKLDTQTYLYGLSTVPGNPDPAASMEQARKELVRQVEEYIKTGGFDCLRERNEYPADLEESVCCLLRPDCYRTIVYIDKARLAEMEKSLAEALNNDSRKEDLSNLVSGILAARKIDEVLNLIAASPLVDEIRTGQKIDNQTQQYANDGLLIYFNPKSKAIMEVMTPADESFARKNAVTGAPASPMRYKNAPLWVYVEGLKSCLAL